MSTTDLKVLPIDFFNLSTQIGAGGKTGSTKVYDQHKHPWQLKKSIFNAPWIRKIKAATSDRENYGEVIAARIGRALTGPQFVPEVRLVFDDKQNELLIASKWFEEKSTTLDAFAKSKLGQWVSGHVQFVRGIAGAGQMSLNDKPVLRKDLARAIAIAAAVGDHDVNPGNMAQNGEHFGRIDLGHAFNDLINTISPFGGRIKNKENRILDFLNREKIGGLQLGDNSKLWRDYPGLIPSQELADSFLEMSKKGQNVASAVNDVRDEFESVYNVADPNLKRHILHSFNEIHKSITGNPLPPGTPSENLSTVFNAINTFTTQNCEDMAYAAKLMQLQVNIDTSIANNDNQALVALQDEYNTLKPTIWIKTNRDIPASKENFAQYVETRKQYIQPIQASMKTETKERSNSTSIKARLQKMIEQSNPPKQTEAEMEENKQNMSPMR